MNYTKAIVDFGIPFFIIVGAGLATFTLTGGVNEYPDPKENETDELISDNLKIGNDEFLDEDFSKCDSNSVLTSKCDSTAAAVQNVYEQLQNFIHSPPLWAKELSKQISCIEADVKELKATLIKPLCDQCRKENATTFKSSSAVISTTNDNFRKTVEDWLQNLRYSIYLLAFGQLHQSIELTDIESNDVTDKYLRAMSVLQNQLSRLRGISTVNDEGNECTEKQHPLLVDPMLLSAGCDMLLMYINNIIKNPNVPRYKRISTSNQSYRTALQGLKGHETVLQAVGFVKKGTYYEWTWELPVTTETTTTATVDSKNYLASSNGLDNSNTKLVINTAKCDTTTNNVTPNNNNNPDIDNKSVSNAHHPPTTMNEKNKQVGVKDEEKKQMSPHDPMIVHKVLLECVELLQSLKQQKQEEFVKLLLEKISIDSAGFACKPSEATPTINNTAIQCIHNTECSSTDTTLSKINTVMSSSSYVDSNNDDIRRPLVVTTGTVAHTSIPVQSNCKEITTNNKNNDAPAVNSVSTTSSFPTNMISPSFQEILSLAQQHVLTKSCDDK